MGESRTIECGNKYPYDAPDSWRMDDDDEKPPAPEDWAHSAARGILWDLNDRRGIKQGFVEVDEEIRVEIVETMASIIRTAKDNSDG